jgi:hypothetical protein
MCNISGVQASSSSSRALYVPLFREEGAPLNPLQLPLRTTEEFMRQARTVAASADGTEEAELSKMTGIKGVPILSCLSSLSLPHSFPADFMHLAYENVLPELLDLWTTNYKGFDSGEEEYSLTNSVLNAVGDALHVSGNTIPSYFGCRTPNPITERFQFTAEAWAMWSLLIAPILLQ